MPRRVALVGANAIVWLTALVSCGDNMEGGTGPELDASTDVTHQEAGTAEASDAQGEGDGLTCNAMNCPGVCCGNSCNVPAVAASCAACSQSILYCNATGIGIGDCRADCTTCSAGAIECFSCATPGSAVGTCSKSAADCGGTSVPCSCASGKASDCPGLEQVCVQSQCLTCGSAASTDGQKCKNGKACSAPASQCQ
jgi:hypothetical protein